MIKNGAVALSDGPFSYFHAGLYKVVEKKREDSTVTVVVNGSKNTIDNISAQNIKAYIDLKGYGVGEHEVEVKVKGDDLKLSYTSKTKKVKIRITEK